MPIVFIVRAKATMPAAILGWDLADKGEGVPAGNGPVRQVVPVRQAGGWVACLSGDGFVRHRGHDEWHCAFLCLQGNDLKIDMYFSLCSNLKTPQGKERHSSLDKSSMFSHLWHCARLPKRAN